MILRNEKQLAKFDYDFAVDGGAQGAIALRPDITALTEGMVITDIYVYVETALDGAATPTVTLGNTDADGFMSDIYALASAGDGVVVRAGEVEGALVWDNTNKHTLAYRVGSDTDLNLTVGAQDLTAGKLQVYVEFFAP